MKLLGIVGFYATALGVFLAICCALAGVPFAAPYSTISQWLVCPGVVMFGVSLFSGGLDEYL